MADENFNEAGDLRAIRASVAALPTAGTAGTPSTNVTTVQGITSGTPVIVGGLVASGAADSGNPVKVAGVYNSTVPAFSTGQRGDFQLDLSGNLKVRLLAASTTGSDGVANTALTSVNLSTDIANSMRPLAIANYCFNGTTWDRVRKSNSTARLLAAANSTNATSVKASAGDLFKIRLSAAAAVFLKLYNKASAPTVGTDTPVMTIALTVGMNEINFDEGHYFSTGIAYALTGAAADADTTAVAANDVTCLNLTYA